jgi:hypothetical protein
LQKVILPRRVSASFANSLSVSINPGTRSISLPRKPNQDVRAPRTSYLRASSACLPHHANADEFCAASTTDLSASTPSSSWHAPAAQEKYASTASSTHAPSSARPATILPRNARLQFRRSSAAARALHRWRRG